MSTNTTMNAASKAPARVSGLLLFILGALLAVALLWWLPHCGGEHVMRCVWMTRAAAGVAGLIALEGLLASIARSAAAAAGLEAGIVLAGILEILVALVLIGPCPNPMMACHAVTEPVIILSGAVIAVVALADMWRLTRRA